MQTPERPSAASVRRFALIASIIYGIVAALWIYTSDGVLDYLAIDTKSLSAMQTWKGGGFVALTSLLLYLILLRRPLDAPASVASIERSDRRSRIVVMVVSALLVFTVLIVVSMVLLSERENILAQAQRTTANLAQVIEEQTARSIDAVDASLKVTHRLLQMPPGDQSSRDEYVNKVLLEQIGNLPFVRAMWVVDSNGNTVHDSDNLPASANYAHRDYFRVHRDDPKRGLYVGEPVVSKLGVWFIPLSRRVDKADGSFGGVIVAALEPRYLLRFYQSIDVGKTGVVALLQTNGALMVRSPEQVELGGKPLNPRPPFVSMLEKADSGSYSMASSVDRVMRIYSYRRVPGRTLVVVLGLGEAESLTGWRTTVLAYSLASLGFVFVIAWLGYLVIRELRRRAIVSRNFLDSERRFRLLWEASADAVVIMDADSVIRYVNPAFERIFGHPPQAMADQNLSMVQPPRLAAAHVKALQQYIASGHRTVNWASIQTVALHRDGHEFPVEVSFTDIGLDGKRMFAGFMRDITERKRAEQAQARLAAIVETSNDAIVSRAPDDAIVSWNASAERMFGWTAQEVIGKSFRSVLGRSGEGLRLRRFERVLQGEPVTTLEEVRLRKDGTPIIVDTTLSAIRDKQGHIEFVSCIMRDVTERKQAEAAQTALESRLRESQKMQAIGTLAGGIAHDFNNVLATILGNAELARQDAGTNAEVLESIGEIRKAAARARDLVQQILAFSRRQPTARKVIDLAPVVHETVRLLRATLPARLTLDVHCEPGTPCVMADASHIQQALINIATNAMQAMANRPGHIGIRLDTVTLDAALVETMPSLGAMRDQHPGQAVRLAISDSGPGMGPEMRQRMFEPFFTTKPVGEGTGLGLSVVHGIVQGHGGIIEVDTKLGHGTTFTIYLPVVSDEVPAGDAVPGDAGPAQVAGSGERILYIDDDEAMVALVPRLLRRNGFRVGAYTDPQAALSALRADPDAFDLVLTDYSMPGLSGLDVALEVRAIRPGLPVVLTSGFLDDALCERARAAGVRNLIFKADDVDVFCASVQSIVAGIAAR